MEAETYVGVDIATAEVRAVAVSEDGRVLAQASEPLPAPVRVGRRSSQHPAHGDVAEAALTTLAQRLRRSPVRAICVTATSGTVLGCDLNGQPSGEALMYDDQRIYDTDTDAELARQVRQLADHDSSSAQRPVVDALLRLAWLERHNPSPRYRHVCDLVLARLAGHDIPTDTSHALKTGADPVRLMWPAQILLAARLPAEKLPDLARPGTAVAELSPLVAARTGIRGQPLLVLGMTDGCCGQIATGAVALGDASSVLGTTLVVKVGTSDPRPAGSSYSHLSPEGVWWSGGASNVGGRILREEFGDRHLSSQDQTAAAHGPATCVRYPLLGIGERFPFRRGDAVGWLAGSPSNRADLYRATLEGIAFMERLSLETCGGPEGSRSLRSAGGGNSSKHWRTIRATVLQRPILLPKVPTSGFGAAVMAAAANDQDLSTTVGKMVHFGHPVEPNDQEASALSESYAVFLDELRRRGWLDGTDASG